MNGQKLLSVSTRLENPARGMPQAPESVAAGTERAESRGITFEEAFCQHYQCPPEAYEREALWRCFYPHAQALVRLLYRGNQERFKIDFAIIRSLGATTSFKEVRAEASYLRSNYAQYPIRRDWLLFRISGRQMLSLASQLLEAQSGSTQFQRKL